VQLVALSPQGGSPTVIGEQIILDPGFLPIPFEVPYDPSQIDPRGTYAVEARLRSGQTVLFVSDRPARVITGGNPARVQLVLVRIH
jgi:putative lipoprotein